MNAIKNNLWQSKEGGYLLMEFALFAVQIITVIFLLNLSIGRYSGDAETKISDFATSPYQQENVAKEKNTASKVMQENQTVTLSRL